MQRSIRKIAVRLWLALLPLEIAASVLAYWTLGWSSACISIGFSAFLNFVFLVIFSFSFWPGVVLAVSYGLLVVGYQTVLGLRWYYVKAEADRIIQWAHSEELMTGNYPADLTSYGFEHPNYKAFIFYHKWADSEGMRFEVSYIVGTESTHHSYVSDRGWFYHDD